MCRVRLANKSLNNAQFTQLTQFAKSVTIRPLFSLINVSTTFSRPCNYHKTILSVHIVHKVLDAFSFYLFALY